jgi:hypothetical protein
MARTLANLLVKISADTRDLEEAFGGSGKITKSISRFGKVIGAGALVGAVGAFAKKSLEAAAANETLIQSFENLTGSATQAKKIYEELLTFSDVTPFEPEQLNKVAQGLLSARIEAGKVVDVTKALGRVAAFTGGSLDLIALNFGQVSAAAKVTEKDITQFRSQNVDLVGILDSVGVSLEDLKKAGEDTGKILTDAFLTAAGEGSKFDEALIAQSKTFNGLVSTLKGKFNRLMIEVGQTILPAARVAAEKLIDAMDGLLEIFKGAVEDGTFNKFTAGLLTVIDVNDIFIRNLDAGLGPIRAFFGGIKATQQLLSGKFKAAIKTSQEAFKDYISPIENLKNIMSDADRISQTYAANLAKLNEVVEDDAIPKAAEETTGAFENQDKQLNKNIKTYENVGYWFQNILNLTRFVTTALDKQLGPLQKIESGFQRAFALSATQVQGENGVETTFTTSATDTDAVTEQTRKIEEAAARQKAVIEELGASWNFLSGIQLTAAQSSELLAFSQTAVGDALLTATQAAVNYAQEGGTSFRELARAALSSAREVIGAKIREAVTFYAASALSKVPFPFGIIAAGLAGAAAQVLFNKLISALKIPAFGDGGYVAGPTLALIGEKGPEYIVPANQGGLPIQVSGTFRIAGNDLVLAVERNTKNRDRRRGPI